MPPSADPGRDDRRPGRRRTARGRARSGRRGGDRGDVSDRGRAPRPRGPRRLRPPWSGAGTIRTTTQLDEALAAGAQFVVSPALDPAVVERCLDAGVPVLPGIATATELNQALALGLRTVKLFPAEPLGGAALIAALAAPFPEARFVPTGGLGVHNAAEYLRLPSVLAIGGSWMVAPKLIAARDLGRGHALTAEAIALAAPA